MKIRRFNESADLELKNQELFDACKDYFSDLIDDDLVDVEFDDSPHNSEYPYGIVSIAWDDSDDSDESYTAEDTDTLENAILNISKRVDFLKDINAKINFLKEEYESKGYILHTSYRGKQNCVYLTLKNIQTKNED